MRGREVWTLETSTHKPGAAPVVALSKETFMNGIQVDTRTVTQGSAHFVAKATVGCLPTKVSMFRWGERQAGREDESTSRSSGGWK